MNGLIQLKSCRFRYPDQDQDLISVKNMGIQRSEHLAVIGPSGCGKSTLLHLIAGLMDPTDGVILIQGTAINQLTGAQRDRFRGQQIGMVFQTFQLLHGFSAYENLLAALMFSSLPKQAHAKRAQSLLEELGIENIHQRVDRLSVGQQQRVAVARAISCSPAVVLADEPTASLDPERTIEAMDLLQSACRSIDASLVCVTHDPSLVSRFDRVEHFDQLNEHERSTTHSQHVVSSGGGR